MTLPASREPPSEAAGQVPDDRSRILLIGATGQIGRELRRSLQPLGRVVCTSRSPGNAAAGALELDLRRPTTIPAVLDRVHPDLVVNAAAYTDVEQAEQEADLAMVINGIAPGVLAEETRRLGAALVHFSTDYVFQGTGDMPWHEQDTPHPINAYGHSKLVGEDAIRGTGADHLIVRTSWVYGSEGRNFVLTMLRLGSERETLHVVDDQLGAPTSARLVADITAQVLAQARGQFVPFLARHGGTLHVSCRGATTWHGLAVEVFQQARRHGAALRVQEVKPITSAEYGCLVQRPANSRLDCRHLRDCFGLIPPDWSTDLGLSVAEILRCRPESLALAPVAAMSATREENGRRTTIG
jgi:dTDP-4-dehydrorhamnose reductase